MATRNHATVDNEVVAVGQRIRDSIPAEMPDQRLAAEAQIEPHALERIFAGTRGISTLELTRLAAVLGADPHFLLTGTPDPHRLTIVSWHGRGARDGAPS